MKDSFASGHSFASEDANGWVGTVGMISSLGLVFEWLDRASLYMYSCNLYLC